MKIICTYTKPQEVPHPDFFNQEVEFESAKGEILTIKTASYLQVALTGSHMRPHYYTLQVLERDPIMAASIAIKEGSALEERRSPSNTFKIESMSFRFFDREFIYRGSKCRPMEDDMNASPNHYIIPKPFLIPLKDLRKHRDQLRKEGSHKAANHRTELINHLVKMSAIGISTARIGEGRLPQQFSGTHVQPFFQIHDHSGKTQTLLINRSAERIEFIGGGMPPRDLKLKAKPGIGNTPQIHPGWVN